MNILPMSVRRLLIVGICAALVLLASPTVSDAQRVEDGCIGGFPPTIVGTSGADILVGTTGPDIISAGAGDDEIIGFGGDDVICGGDGNDTINGGAGNDTIFGDAGDDTIIGRSGADYLYGGSGNDVINAGSGNDRIAGGIGDDVAMGRGGDDQIAGFEGNDRLRGNAGDDVIAGGPGVDPSRGGPGNDRCDAASTETVVCEEVVQLTFHQVDVTTTAYDLPSAELFGAEPFTNGEIRVVIDEFGSLPVWSAQVTGPSFSVELPQIAGNLYYRSEYFRTGIGGETVFADNEPGPIDVEVFVYAF